MDHKEHKEKVSKTNQDNVVRMVSLDKKKAIENIKDSIYHALDHYFEMSQTSKTTHHFKWITFSIHHAVEIYLYLLLSELDPKHELLNKTKRDGNPYYPSAVQTLKALKKKKVKLLHNETKLLEFFDPVINLRNEIVHNPSSEMKDISPVALASLLLLRSLALRKNIKTEELFDLYPPIEPDILDLLRINHFNEYIQFVNEAVKIENPNISWFNECPLCGAMAIVHSRCEGCFEDMSVDECVSCGEEIVTSMSDLHRSESVQCPCGVQQDETS